MNPNYFRIAMPVLFLPFKLKANTTSYVLICYSRQLFLPFKLKANTTFFPGSFSIGRCFCLSN